MSKKLTRILCGVMVAVLIIGFLAMLAPTKAADALTYRYGPNNVIYNWGQRGEAATALSPNALEFYSENNVTYEQLAALSGSSTVSSIPSSPLYQELRDLMVSNHKKQTSYDATRDLYQYTDCMSNGQHETLGNRISSFYSGAAIGPSWDGGSTWNREHTWPNSKGDANGNGENDIIMLRPTASSENTSRGNKAYGESAGTTYYDPNLKSGGTYNLRGDVARIVLYVYTRWQNTSDSDARLFGGSGVMESKEVLLKWMAEDPVDTWEMGRNDSTESITGTRNVFVDYPELAFTLFGEAIPADMATPSNGNGTSVAPSVPTADPIPETVTAPAVGTAYKLFMNKTNESKVMYFNGQTESADVTYRLATVREASAATEVYLEEAVGGYHLYFMNGGTKTYIRIYERTDDVAGKGKGSLELVTEKPAEVLTYDSTANTLIYTADDGENAYYLGTYGTYSTFSVSNTSYITGNNASKVDVEQFPARFADASFEGGSGTPIVPTTPTTAPTTTPTTPTNPNPGTSGAYNKISTLAELTSGEYVMTVATGYAPGVVDGTWITAVQPTISGTTVTNPAGGVWTLTVNGNKVILCDANGVYVGPKGGNYNGIKTGTAYEWEVSCENGEFVFKGTGADTVALASNTDPEYANKFRGYKTTTITDAAKYPSTFTLYKGDGEGGSVTPPPVVPDEPDVPVAPDFIPTPVAPTAGTAYKLYMNKTSDGKYLYFNGYTESETVTYRLATTEDPAAAVDVFVEANGNGYALYFMNGGTKTYIRVYEREALEAGKGKGSLELVTEKPAEALTYNTDYNTLVLAASADNSYYMGTYSTYSTFSVSNLSYMSAENLDASQFPAHFTVYSVSEEPAKSGWVYENGAWYYYENGQMFANRWFCEYGNCYRFNENGQMLANCWFYSYKEGEWYWFNENGTMAASQWILDGGKRYYLNAVGYMAKKFALIDGYWYWFGDYGVMADNEWALIDGYWYWFQAGGQMAVNCWKLDSNGWVHLGKDGAMQTNTWCMDGQGWCYVNAYGYAVTNCWKQDSIGWIYLNANGSMTKDQWLYDGGKWYYLDANGYMVTNQWMLDSVGWVHLGEDGAMQTNIWCMDGQGWCYVGADGYAVTNCWKQDSVGWIYLNSNGSMTKNQWLYDGGNWYYLDANGYMMENQWLFDGANWFYLGAGGCMLSNTSLTQYGVTYYFNASGICTNP